ncbi:MAG: SDR family NAD(P)-dependent oxidoreductase [Holophagaceae bacterium]|jgi:NAD(P)-dependent dehydrogenase (short-subunit alcohol dehydrogenase family)|nr:short-chain dehydrogenase [Acidobacteriota bacterium]
MSPNPKNFLILGGIGGIGGFLTDRLIEQGHRVFVTTRNPQKVLQSSVDQDHTLVVDVLNPDSIQQAVATASQEGLDGLAYCIGSLDLKPLARSTREDLLRSFEVNTVGAFLAIKESSAALKEKRGSVILFSSIAATRGFVNHSSIGAAKASVEGLARSLAAELAPHIRVNVIAPSLTSTPLTLPLTQNPKMAEAIASLHPIPKLGDPREIASLAYFLLSDQSSWITGQVFHIDGGRSTLDKKP